LALGHGFGRIGCFSAGCCYGRVCSLPWGVNFHNEYSHELTGITQGIPLHPTQLYEAILNFLNFFVLFFFLKRKRFDGQIFSLLSISDEGFHNNIGYNNNPISQRELSPSLLYSWLDRRTSFIFRVEKEKCDSTLRIVSSRGCRR